MRPQHVIRWLRRPIECAFACWVIRATQEGPSSPRFRLSRRAAPRTRVAASTKLPLGRLLDHRLELLAGYKLDARILLRKLLGSLVKDTATDEYASVRLEILQRAEEL